MEILDEFEKKETKTNKEIKNGHYIITGKNMIGKTRMISKLISEHSLDPFICSLNHFICLQTPN